MSWECVSYWIEHHPGLASWVQAIGSIGAIIAAGYFPIAHEKAREKRDRRNVLRSLSYLADPLERFMKMLSRALLEVDYQNRWLAGDESRELGILGKSLNEIPANMVVAFEITLLTDLKFAYEYAAEIDQYLRVTKSTDLSALPDNLGYHNGCENCISKIEVVKETLVGLIQSNR
ncbi:hypothetical protein [Pseudomonas sp. A34-9]|uniref:hypothetical protein n=1 Tax=Pseudomonas sp. A34-9 TaxID=3034675 RepID=UPI00240DE94F|nr:hypothetical protein [Pseudomonas sp. A34-9]